MKYTEDQMESITKAANRLSADNVAARAPRTTTPTLAIEIAGREHSMEVERHQDAEALALVINACVEYLTEFRGLTDSAPVMPSLTDAIQVTSLDLDDYIKLARRTLDPEMTRRERLAMLAMGLIGEWGELQTAIQEGDADRVLSECGDVLWYASILFDETCDGEYDSVNLSQIRDWNALVEDVKKAIFHDVNPGILYGIADDALSTTYRYIREHGGGLAEVRYQNIRKLLERYPDGFVKGGGER